MVLLKVPADRCQTWRNKFGPKVCRELADRYALLLDSLPSTIELEQLQSGLHQPVEAGFLM